MIAKAARATKKKEKKAAAAAAAGAVSPGDGDGGQDDDEDNDDADGPPAKKARRTSDPWGMGRYSKPKPPAERSFEAETSGIPWAQGVALAEFVAGRGFAESGEAYGGAWDFTASPPPPPPGYVFADRRVCFPGDAGPTGRIYTPPKLADGGWAALKVELARAGWGYVGHGDYGDSCGVSPEDCEGW